MTNRQPRRRFRAAAALLAGALALTGTLASAAAAHAQRPVDATLTFPASGEGTTSGFDAVVNVTSASSGTLGSTLVCPGADGQPGTGGTAWASWFLTTPGNEIATLPEGASIWDGAGYYTYVNYGSHGVDVDGKVVNDFLWNQFSSSWIDLGGSENPLAAWLTPDTTYSLGLVCITDDANGYYARDADGTSIAVWGTFQTDANKNWTFTTPKKSSTTSLAASKTGSYGATLTATVPSDATGDVEFFEGETSVGKATVSSGTATLSLTGLSVDTHSYTATYLGDGSYNSSPASDPASVTIEFVKLDTAVTLAAELISDTEATLTATVAAEGATATAATGDVEFFRDGTSIGTESSEDGIATLTDVELEAGKTYAYTAQYSGDATYNASVRSAAKEIVTPTAPIELKAGDKATPGVRYYVDAAEGTFVDGDTVTGVVNSDPITLSETATAAADGSATFVFTLPAKLADSTEKNHLLVLTGDPSDRILTVTFTIDPAQPAGETTPVPGTGGGKTDNTAGLASTGIDGSALAFAVALGAGALLLGVAAVAAVQVRRRRFNIG